MCERTLTHQFAKWAKVDNLAEALCWMILKGGGKGVPGRTFKAFEELQSLADSPDGGSDTTSDGGSDTTSSLADVNRDLENIVLDDDPPATYVPAGNATNGRPGHEWHRRECHRVSRAHYGSAGRPKPSRNPAKHNHCA